MLLEGGEVSRYFATWNAVICLDFVVLMVCDKVVSFLVLSVHKEGKYIYLIHCSVRLTSY